MYVQETLAELERIIEYAAKLRQNFDLGRDGSVLTELMSSIYSLPSRPDGENLDNVIFDKDSSSPTNFELDKKLAYRNLFSGLYGVIPKKFSHGDRWASIHEFEAALSSINLDFQIL